MVEATATTLLRLVGGGALLLMNAFFVTSEFAMTRVPQFSESEFSGDPGLERAWEMTERLEVYLSGCQVGITVASVGLGVVAEPAVAAVVNRVFGALGGTAPGHGVLSVAVSLAVINLAHIVAGEQAPTYLGVERTKSVARYCAPGLYWWTTLMGPVITAADWTAKRLLGVFGVTITQSWREDETLSRADLRTEMGTVLSQGKLPRERREEVLGALDIGATEVGEIMVPRDEMVVLSTDEDVEATLDRMHAEPHVRFPLVGEEYEEFLGIVYTPAIVDDVEALRSGEETLENLAAPPMTVAADTTVSDLIDQFQAESQELALVLDAGRVVGLVTQTDAVEEITGEFSDPFDES